MKKLACFLSLLITVSGIYAQSSVLVNPGDTLGIWSINSFEEPTEFITIGSSASNIWQIGHPQKTVFNSAYSGDHAMVTDTMNPYPAMNYSYFDLYLGPFNFNTYYFPLDMSIDFRHKFDTDTLHDGGYVTISWDKGQSWENVIFNTIPQEFGIAHYNGSFYSEMDTLFNGEYGFSGRSNGWVHSYMSWEQIMVKKSTEFPPDTAILRFNFISDNNDNAHDGWMIDQIRLFSIELNGGIPDGSTGYPVITVAGNPGKENSLIQFDKSYRSNIGQLYTMDGRKVRTFDFSNTDKYLFQRDGLKSGLYLLKARINSAETVTQKLILID